MLEEELPVLLVQLPPALLLLVEFFRVNHHHFNLPGLFDATYPNQEFKEYELLLSQEYSRFPMKFANAYFFASYFKNYFVTLIMGIQNTLIPKHQFDVPDTLDGLPHKE